MVLFPYTQFHSRPWWEVADLSVTLPLIKID